MRNIPSDPLHKRRVRASLALVLVACTLGLILLGLVLLGLRQPPASMQEHTVMDLQETLGEDAIGFAQVLKARDFDFPGDHGSHTEYRNEWWYFTGNLEDRSGRKFGFQLTFFRSSLDTASASSQRSSLWATREVYMAHFALSNPEVGRKEKSAPGEKPFYAFERFSRGALGLAGTEAGEAEPFRVWLENWSAGQIASREPGHESPPGRITDSTPRQSAGPQGILPLRLSAQSNGVSLDLILEKGKPLVLHGDRGMSVKGPEPGNASYYYSFTRLPTRGDISLGGKRHRVTGESWMDHEWGTSFLGRERSGWDWFALQFSDGTELMHFRIRPKDSGDQNLGGKDFASGTWIDAEGRSLTLDGASVTVQVLDSWTSPAGKSYPSRWRLLAPKLGLDVDVRPLLKAQELPLSVRYWEGAVEAEGMRAGLPVSGRGYVELTGY